MAPEPDIEASDPDIEAWVNRGSNIGYWHMSGQQRQEAFMKAFPTREDRLRLWNWSNEQSMKRFVQPQTTPVSNEEFIEQIDTMDYTSEKEEGKVVEWMQRVVRPWIPLGRDAAGTAYRLVPNPYGLRAQRLDHEELPGPFMNDSHLGVNTTVQPKEPSQPASRRKVGLSEVSTLSAESDEASPGFEFFQLGNMEYHLGDLPPTMEEAGKSLWMPTGFFVVARFGASGHIEGVYVVFDMFPEDEDGERVQITDGDWGRLPSSAEQFTCARIGHRLREFGFSKQLEWAEKVEHPVELVPLVRRSDGRAMRWMMDKKP